MASDVPVTVMIAISPTRPARAARATLTAWGRSTGGSFGSLWCRELDLDVREGAGVGDLLRALMAALSDALGHD